MISNCNVTLYTRSVVDRDAHYESSFIYGVMWQADRAVMASQGHVVESNTVIVYIPIGTTEITIAEGDIMVRGIIEKSIDDDYTITDLRNDYPQSMLVKSVSINDYSSPLLKHIKVGGA